MAIRKLAASSMVVASLLLAAPAAQANITYTASAVPFTFTDISATGTVLATLTNEDDVFQNVALPFSFSFFEDAYNSVFVSSNGLLTFGSGDDSFTNADLTAFTTRAAIAPFWDDLVISNRPAPSTARVLTQIDGPAGSRQFIIQWDQVNFFANFNGTETLTFQAILFESTGNILFNYLDLVSGADSRNDGASATVGIKDAGVQGPDRLVLAFNNGPNEFVGSRQSTLITPVRVPEPASAALLGLGLALLGAMRRRSLR